MRLTESTDFRNSETPGLQLINALVEQIKRIIELEIGKKQKLSSGSRITKPLI